MDFYAFKLAVAAAAQRDASAFVNGSTDLLSLAVNMARKSVERARDFELAKVLADLTVSVTDGADLADAKVAGSATAVSIKTILRAQLSTDGGTSFVPIDVISRDSHMRSVGRRHEKASTVSEMTDTQPTETHKYVLVRFGDSVYLSPSDTTSYDGQASVIVRMDVVKWLDEYVENTDTDFLIEHCYDYLLLVSLVMLQLFVKEDVRMPVTDAKMKEAWQSLVQWDANLTLTSDDMNLD